MAFPQIKIRYLTEAEAPHLPQIMTAAFYAANDHTNRIMFPNGPTPELVQFFSDKSIKDFREAGPNKSYLGAFIRVPRDADVPTALNAAANGIDPSETADQASVREVMIAGALWERVEKPPAAADTPPRAVPPDCNAEARHMFSRMLASGPERIMPPLTSAPYWSLDLLGTDPAYGRRGAAGLLLKWGLDRADEEGAYAFLDGTMLGRPFYEKVGFRAVGDYTLDGPRWGSERVGHTYPMVRAPEGKDDEKILALDFVTLINDGEPPKEDVAGSNGVAH